MQPVVENKIVCDHCGENCFDNRIRLEDHVFCCEGCRLVYQLINQSGLCEYYQFNKQPGISRRTRTRKDKFAFLDDPSITGQLANGLLPCGMVYLAIAGALNVSQVKSGVLFMAMFGLGTLPPLFALSYFGSLIKLSLRNKIRQITPFIVAVMAVALILRGLNLGIPFISPLLGVARAPAIICH
jgi:sulfite exporter TauE/SafE